MKKDLQKIFEAFIEKCVKVYGIVLIGNVGVGLVGNCVFGANVVIGSKKCFCEKSREALRDVCSLRVSVFDWDEMIGNW